MTTPLNKPKTIVLAEDDPLIQHLCRKGFHALEGFTVLYAGNGAEAMEHLNQEAVALLVTDLNMPVMDGYELIIQARRRHPTLPILVLTAIPRASRRDFVLDQYHIQVLAKPPDFPALIAAIRDAVERPEAGLVRGLPLLSLLQLLNWERRSCQITVHAGPLQGQLYLQGGEILQASLPGAAGIIAVHEILSWDSTEIEFFSSSLKVEDCINMPISELLLNAAIMRDHRSAGVASEGET